MNTVSAQAAMIEYEDENRRSGPYERECARNGVSANMRPAKRIETSTVRSTDHDAGEGK
jgi:hypothetical protein